MKKAQFIPMIDGQIKNTEKNLEYWDLNKDDQEFLNKRVRQLKSQREFVMKTYQDDEEVNES